MNVNDSEGIAKHDFLFAVTSFRDECKHGVREDIV